MKLLNAAGQEQQDFVNRPGIGRPACRSGRGRPGGRGRTQKWLVPAKTVTAAASCNLHGCEGFRLRRICRVNSRT